MIRQKVWAKQQPRVFDDVRNIHSIFCSSLLWPTKSLRSFTLFYCSAGFHHVVDGMRKCDATANPMWSSNSIHWLTRCAAGWKLKLFSPQYEYCVARSFEFKGENRSNSAILFRLPRNSVWIYEFLIHFVCELSAKIFRYFPSSLLPSSFVLVDVGNAIMVRMGGEEKNQKWICSSLSHLTRVRRAAVRRNSIFETDECEGWWAKPA